MRSPTTPSFVNVYEYSSMPKFNNNNKLLSQYIYQSVPSNMDGTQHQKMHPHPQIIQR